MKRSSFYPRVSAVTRDMIIARRTSLVGAPLGATHAAPMGLVSTVVTKVYNHFAPLALLGACIDLPTKARQILQK
jgi:hypothetical protein